MERVKWFSALQAGPQSKANARVRHPLLARHLAVWRASKGSTDGDILSGPTVVAADSDDIVAYFAGLSEWIEGQAGARSKIGIKNVEKGAASGIEETPAGAIVGGLHPPLTFKFRWWHFDVLIRLEFHTEYFTFTTFLDASQNIPPTTRRRYIDQAKTRGIDFADLLAVFSDHAENFQEMLSESDYRAKFAPFADASFTKIWEVFERDILKGSKVADRNLGRAFADFRGLILGERQILASDGSNLPRSQVQLEDEHLIAKANWRAPRTFRRPPRVAFKGEKDRFWQRRYNVLWPLITATSDAPDPTAYEVTVCNFLQDKAMYLSSLGAQSPKASAEAAAPLLYCIYTHELGGWSIGRIVEQIHELGTLRLAALFDQAGLNAAEQKIQAAADASSEAMQAGNRHLDRAINTIQARLEEANQLVIGGVEYRIERSRYYLLQFRNRVGRLEIKPFGDHLPYDAFVDKRLGQEFGQIDALWSRYDRIKGDQRILYQRSQTEHIRHTTRSIEAFQEAADFILIVFLVPYYFSSILGHLFAGLLWDRLHHDAPNMLWRSIFVLFIWIAMARSRPWKNFDSSRYLGNGLRDRLRRRLFKWRRPLLSIPLLVSICLFGLFAQNVLKFETTDSKASDKEPAHDISIEQKHVRQLDNATAYHRGEVLRAKIAKKVHTRRIT